VRIPRYFIGGIGENFETCGGESAGDAKFKRDDDDGRLLAWQRARRPDSGWRRVEEGSEDARGGLGGGKSWRCSVRRGSVPGRNPHCPTLQTVCGPASEALDAAFLEGYLSIQPELDIQKAAQHLAMHLVIWTARVGWEPAEKTRALVEHGLRSITL